MSLIDHPIHEPATEIVPDDAALRAARRERVLAEMERADVDILVIGREANARYVAGVRRLWTAGSRAFGAGCVLIRDGDDPPVEHVGRGRPRRHPPRAPLRHLVQLADVPARAERTRRCGHGAHRRHRRAHPLGRRHARQGLPRTPTVVDGEQLLRRARSTKLPAEVDAIRASIGIAERALAVTLDALAPGRHRAPAHRRVHGGDGEPGRDHAGDAGRRVDHLARAAVAALEPRHPGGGRRPRRVRRGRDQRRLLRRAEPDRRRRRTERPTSGRGVVPAPRRVARPAAGGMRAGRAGERSARRLRRGRRRARRPCRSPAGWATASTCRS